jgi:uncharacterized short protein YbdD (DUF466 family)
MSIDRIAIARMRERLGVFAHRARAVVGRVIGAPDYEAYVEHMRLTHPGERPLARGEFFAWALERKHAGRGPRCC